MKHQKNNSQKNVFKALKLYLIISLLYNKLQRTKAFYHTRKILIVFLIALLALPALGQDYHTIKVNGTILLIEKNAELQRGMIFAENDSLVFKTYNSLATVIHPEKGRFILRPDNVDLAYAKASYTPAMSNIKSRSIGDDINEEDIDLSKAKASFTPAISNVSSRSSELNSLNDLQNHFHGNYAIINNIKLFINPEKFPMTNEKFFFIRYEIEREPIFKKLDFKNDTLIIDKKELLTIDSIPVSDPNLINEMEVWYMERDKEDEVTYIGTFEPVFLNENQLHDEVSVILEVFDSKDHDEKMAEILSFINEFYGKPNRNSIEIWVNNKMDL